MSEIPKPLDATTLRTAVEFIVHLDAILKLDVEASDPAVRTLRNAVKFILERLAEIERAA
jgi:hypothetical protein